MVDDMREPDHDIGSADGEMEERREERRQNLDEKRKSRRIVRLREIEKGGPGKKGHIFGSDDDRINAAREVGRLVRAARDENVTVESIKQVLPGTARLDRYMLSPEIDAAGAKRKLSKLQKRVLGYLDVATAVAKLTFQDPDKLKIGVLIKTSLWSRPSLAQTEDDPRAAHLALELREMGRAVAARHRLEDLLGRARRIPGVWSPTMLAFRSSSMACLFKEAYLNDFEHWTEAPPLPSVPLMRHLHSTFGASVRIEAVGRAERLAGDAHDFGFDGPVQTAQFELWREVRMALGPVSSADDVGPMFESRWHVRLELEPAAQVSSILHPSCSLKPIDDFFSHLPASVFQVQIGELWHRVAMTEDLNKAEAEVLRPGDDAMMWPQDPLDPASPPIEHWYFAWSAINAESVRYWLDRPLASSLSVMAPFDGGRNASAAWYARPSAAHDVEHALACGGIEKALDEAIRHLREELDRREGEWRKSAAAAHEKLMSEWQREGETGDAQSK